MPKLQRKNIVEEIGEKTVLTETRYPQEILIRAGRQTLLLQMWHSFRDWVVVPYSSDKSSSDQNRDTDPGRS